MECQQRTVEDSPASPTVGNPTQKRKNKTQEEDELRSTENNKKNQTELEKQI